MTTDLTDDSELSEEGFDWDVFVPDPDDAEIAAEAAALEDQDELDLDDSDLDWEAALQEPEVLGGAEGEARAGAAFDRIVDTVRRSIEDPEDEIEEDLEPVESVEAVEAVEAVEREIVPVQDDALPLEMEPAAEAAPPAPVIAFEPAPEMEADELVPEVEAAAPAEPDFSQEAAWEPGPEPEPHTVATFGPQAPTVEVASAGPTWITAEEPEAVQTHASGASEHDDVHGDAHDESEATSDRHPTRARTRKNRERQPRSRIFTATVVLLCVLLVLAAAAVAVRSLHHSTPTTPSAKAPARSAPRVSPSPDAGRIQTATDAVDSATTAAQVGLTSLAEFPTTSNVARVIYPYISSLQLYESFLAGSTVPVAARAAAASAAAQVRQELTFLDTIASLPPEQLGTYLEQFGTDAARLQATLGALEQDLRTPTS
jgi:hypothetical protein